MSAVQDANCIVIMTEWDEFINYDYKQIRDAMSANSVTLYDLRSYLNLEKIK